MSTSATLERSTQVDVDYWAEEVEDADQEERSLLDRVAEPAGEPRSDDRLLFEVLADELESAMLGSSSTRRVAREPAYGEILQMGEAVIPFLLERLDEPGVRPLWLRLLGSLTTFQPGAGEATIEDAARTWTRWGRLRGYASP